MRWITETSVVLSVESIKRSSVAIVDINEYRRDDVTSLGYMPPPKFCERSESKFYFSCKVPPPSFCERSESQSLISLVGSSEKFVTPEMGHSLVR